MQSVIPDFQNVGVELRDVGRRVVDQVSTADLAYWRLMGRASILQAIAVDAWSHYANLFEDNQQPVEIEYPVYVQVSLTDQPGRLSTEQLHAIELINLLRGPRARLLDLLGNTGISGSYDGRIDAAPSRQRYVLERARLEAIQTECQYQNLIVFTQEALNSATQSDSFGADMAGHINGQCVRFVELARRSLDLLYGRGPAWYLANSDSPEAVSEDSQEEADLVLAPFLQTAYPEFQSTRS